MPLATIFDEDAPKVESPAGSPELKATPPAPRARAGRRSPSSARRGPFRPGQLVPARARIEARILARAFRGLDAVTIAVAAILLFADQPDRMGSLASLVGCGVLFLALRGLDAYAFAHRERLPRHLFRVVAAAGAAAAAGLGLTLLTGAPADGLWGLLALTPCLMALHVAWWGLVVHGRRQGRLTPNIVVVGATGNARRLIEAAMRTGEVNVLGIFDDRLDRAPDDIHGVPVLGDTRALVDHRVMPYVDRVVIAVTSTAEGRVRQLVERLNVLPNPISLYIDLGRDADSEAAVSRIADAALADLSGAPANSRKAILKRAQDLVVASVGLAVAAPFMALIALAVRLDSPGPIFFRQRRHGFNNEEILVWKFRSMRHEMADATAAQQVQANDARVTRVGNFIRLTSLDELPQLFNVLRGEMSIVGPRPHAVGMKTGDIESAKLVGQYAHRHRMKPGLTGWAAIKGSRGPVDTPELVRERIALDVEYIERHSFWLDLYIIVMTIPCLLGDRSVVR